MCIPCSREDGCAETGKCPAGMSGKRIGHQEKGCSRGVDAETPPRTAPGNVVAKGKTKFSRNRIEMLSGGHFRLALDPTTIEADAASQRILMRW